MSKEILIVDDNYQLTYAMIVLLEKMGYNARGAISSSDALDLISKQKFDIILTDLEMPNLTGLELCRKIRKHEIDQRSGDRATILAFSAFTAEFGVEKLEEVGFDGWIDKPITREKMEEFLKDF